MPKDIVVPEHRPHSWIWIAGIVLALFLALHSMRPAVAADAPEATIRTATADVLAALRGAPPEVVNDSNQLVGRVYPVVAQYLDLDRMSQLVLGRYWKPATPAQRRDFRDRFQDLLTRFYATSVSALLEGVDPQTITIDVHPADMAKNARRATVRTHVNLLNAAPIQMSYKVYRVGEAWKVYDMSIEGVSIVTNYRASFTGEIRARGLDSLIQRLADEGQPT